MPSNHILREIGIQRTPRVMQVEGIFDLQPSRQSREAWAVDLELPEQWNVGLIVGPSGSGKTTVARELFGSSMVDTWDWPSQKSVLDGFPHDMSIKDIVSLMSSVGFSSPPSWLRPYSVLSNGEQFRANMARTLAEMPDLAVVDEFTSVVDRTVARIGSAAVAKTVRRRNQQFIAVTCHYDVIEWLEPDWIYQPHINELARGCLQRRPPIELTIRRVHHSAWQLFRKHHYLNTNLNKAAVCFVAFWDDIPVAFSSWLHFLTGTAKNAKREHRTVCLPDYQGIGIGNAVSDYCAAIVTGLGYEAISTTSNPAMITARNRSLYWAMTSASGLNSGGGKLFRKAKGLQYSFNRATTSFKYIGPKLDYVLARSVWEGHQISEPTELDA